MYVYTDIISANMIHPHRILISNFLSLTNTHTRVPHVARASAAGSEALLGCRAEGPATHTASLPAHRVCRPSEGRADEVPGAHCLRVYVSHVFLQLQSRPVSSTG